MKEPPEKELVTIDFGFVRNVDADDERGVLLAVREDGSRKIIGFLYFARDQLGDLMSGRAEQPALWQQYRPQVEA